jgi:small-conductance mechanosensitive channel
MTTHILEKWLFDPTVGKFVGLLVGILLVTVISRLLKKSLVNRIYDTSIRYRVSKFVTYLSYTLVILIATLVFSDRLGNLTVAFGVAGAGITFALQEVIISLAGWFAISFVGFYKNGDRVQIGDIRGDVIDISLLRTTLMEIGKWVKGDQYSGRIVQIANSFVFKEPVYNYSGDFPFLWDELVIPVKYGSDQRVARSLFTGVLDELVSEYPEKAAEAWKRMVRKFSVDLTPVTPSIILALNDNWMEFTLRYIVAYKQRRAIKDRLFTRILEAIDATNGEISIASTTIQFVDLPELKMRINAPEKD